MPKYQVIFHLDELNKAPMVFKNIENLIADLGRDNLAVELVANAEGILAFLKQPGDHLREMSLLAEKGVKFVACANAMRQNGITKDILFDSTAVVPSGVGELVKKQSQGWTYIRP